MQDPVLENILEQMRETEARRADLERQHAEAQHHLREKLAGRYQGPESVEALQSKIRELEKKTELQMVRHEELSLELTSLKRARSRAPSALGHPGVPSNQQSLQSAASMAATATWPPAGSEIDRLMAKLELDRYRTSGRLMHELEHARNAVTTQQPSMSQSLLRSSAENLTSLGHQHPPPHPHALSLGMPAQHGHYAGSPMPLTPMMPGGCPALTPNGPPYHYNEPIPPAPSSSLSTSQSQPAFQQKLTAYQHQQQQQHQQSSAAHMDMTAAAAAATSHAQSAAMQKQQQQQSVVAAQTHSHFAASQYQESYPHTQTYQQPQPPLAPGPSLGASVPQQTSQQSTGAHHPSVSSSYLASVSQSQHYTQPGLSTQSYQLNGTQQQSTTFPSLPMTSLPNSTYSTVQQQQQAPTSYSSQLGHPGYSVAQPTSLGAGSSSLPSSLVPFSTSPYHSSLTGLTTGVTQSSVLPYSTATSTFSTAGAPGTSFTNVGTNAFGTTGVAGTGSSSLLDPLQAMQHLSAQSQANQLQQQVEQRIIQQIQQSLHTTSPTPTSATGAGASHHFLGPRQMPKIPTSILTNPLDRLSSGADSGIVTEGQVDMLDIPGKGRCYVYIARFTYEPFQHSPNENPEAELPVHGGDYLLVWGQPDEDGFLDAETLDGRRGLVPANFVQKLIGDDLLEFHQAVLGLRDVDDAVSTNIPQCYLQDIDLELAALEEGSRNRHAELTAYADLESLEEDEQEPPVPAPQHLTLERQLNKSVLIGWTAPDNPHQIECYHVYVDGVLKVTVKATDRTRALVEGVDSTRPHRISVRSVTHTRRTSRDAACTMVIGKDVAIGPTAVKASHVTATSAVISWLPSNSNHQHVVCVNNVEVRTVKPGVYRHTITGLAPSTVYRVTVKAKNLRATHFEDQNVQSLNNQACHVHFKTLPKGLPDPPVNIQVEAGPQDGTLLVTWQPVALNGSAVTGYSVYADGKKVTDVDSPTGDHALVDIHKLMGLNPKHITVRTKSRESQSSDSCATAIPCSVLRGGAAQMQHQQMQMQQMQHQQMQHQQMQQMHPQQMHQQQMHPQQMHQQQQQDLQQQMHPQMQDQSGMGMMGPVGPMDGVQQGMVGGPRYGPQNAQLPPHMRHQQRPGARLDAHGQMIIETDENLSDKEIYPGQSMSQMVGGQRGRGPAYRGGHMGQAQAGPHRSPGVQPMNKRFRWFVAMFEYDPRTMSPNPDACEEELPFFESDIIKVYGDKDADGFYWGECHGRRGYVPHNMVQEITDPNQLAQLQSRSSNMRRGPVPNDRLGDIYANMPVKKMIALYDYDPHELSPNVDAEQVELSFRTGNEIYVYGEMDDDGFYMGELNGMRGLVPSNFLTEAAGPGQGPSGPPGSRRPPGPGQGPGARGPPPPPREVPGQRRNKAYQQANHHSYTSVTASNQMGPAPGMGPHNPLQPGQMPPHMQQQGRGRGVVNQAGGSNMPRGPGMPGQMQPGQPGQPGQMGPGGYQQQGQGGFGPQGPQGQQQQQYGPQGQVQQYGQQGPQGQQQYGPQGQVQQYGQQGPQGQQQFGQQGPQGMQGQQQQPGMPGQQQQQQQGQQQYGPGSGPGGMMSGPQASKPMRGVPTVIPTITQPQPTQQQQQGQQQPGAGGPNLMQKFTEMAGAGAGGDILSKGKELIFMKFGLGK